MKMILNVKADIKQIFKQGKKFKWQRPVKCKHCGEPRLWGHGFVLSFFDDFGQGLYLKRYRCPYCHTVFKLKPSGYFKRFQADIKTIFASVLVRIYNSRYLSRLSWSRQHFWFTALKCNVTAYLSNTWNQGLAAGFMELIKMNKLPVTSSI
jgi:DNA-directed RNA polymerase subunit RPC12/RpoP